MGQEDWDEQEEGQGGLGRGRRTDQENGEENKEHEEEEDEEDRARTLRKSIESDWVVLPTYLGWVSGINKQGAASLAPPFY